MKKKISWGLFGVGVLMLIISVVFRHKLFYTRVYAGWMRNDVYEKYYFQTIGILVLSIFFINFKLFFFGFLKAEKWKRLIRTILIIGVISIIIFLEDSQSVREDELSLIFLFICIPSISLISWVVKPFVIKENKK
ncbi:hypothetical protein N9820_02855 [Polaribacter sp.]|nr:hypothetical protein [Polaribacter sp.]MDB4241850.1 hypothetical protein [Polaribacter sp.]|tara:strand:- start:40 stop:444 length:405 start_codon:yes stop_codon:yes gene_type:complete